jgi:N-acetylated-alpha-linked acidic dipeptidase
VKTLPAVREAIEGSRWDEANNYAGITTAVLSSYCEGIERATALLNGAK